ncbi:hypothetical protein [Myroides pelagicus]|uniref:Uncharacterized protein n=1 Tax=Myroides pelagicus TaxID=270914 RepID=A0A7K1GR33_9FLAO|nr:hypothetical protein [Myroides pelagicus]MEC4115088.1 hypothetical protein [Myroides pelagicus]MTH30584.1 hypothetical protein [Myroides pelagicus]
MILQPKIINKLDKDTLVNFLNSYSLLDQNFTISFNLFFASKDILKQTQVHLNDKISIRIKTYLDINNDFLTLDTLSELISELDTYFLIADLLIENKKYKSALIVLKSLLSNTINLSNNCDDSNDHLNVFITETIESILRIASENKNSKTHDKITKFLNKQLDNPTYRSFGYDFLIKQV